MCPQTSVVIWQWFVIDTSFILISYKDLHTKRFSSTILLGAYHLIIHSSHCLKNFDCHLKGSRCERRPKWMRRTIITMCPDQPIHDMPKSHPLKLRGEFLWSKIAVQAGSRQKPQLSFTELLVRSQTALTGLPLLLDLWWQNNWRDRCPQKLKFAFLQTWQATHADFPFSRSGGTISIQCGIPKQQQ